MSESESKSDLHGTLRSLRWPAVVVVLLLVPLVAFVLFLKFTKDTTGKVATEVTETVRAVGEQVAGIAARFKQGEITQTFLANIPTISRAEGGNLEVATAEAVETFTREDARSIAWDYIPLGVTVSEIKVPVTYRYHLRLRDDWRLDVSNQTCIVYAPRIRPSQPPAIHTDRMEKRSSQGWARFDGRAQMEELEKTITPTLKVLADDPKHLSLVREECRQTVAEFVRDWLLREEHWREDRFSAIKVVFADETNQPTGEIEFTLQLEEDGQE
jgi:hypothetical protein